MTFPSPFNPDNLPPAAPGFRYLGADEFPTSNDWFKTGAGWVKSRDNERAIRPNLTYRRALCVDDMYAPPPSEWLTPGYQVMGPVAVNGYSPSTDEQHWWGGGWTGSTPGGVFGLPGYVRRKTQASAPSASSLNTKREVVVYVGDSVALSDMLKAIFKTDTPTRPYTGYVLIRGEEIYGCDKDVTWYQNELKGAVYLDARSEMGKLIDLLPSLKASMPTAPTINGYVAQYTKGSSTVTFGCAQISTTILGTAAYLMGVQTPIGKRLGQSVPVYAGNRSVASITLDSGVKLGREDVKSILAYVDQVNGVDAPRS